MDHTLDEIGIVAILGLGPFGAFIAIFICASTGGIIGMEGFKWGGGRIYDAGNSMADRWYYSADELIGAFHE